MEGQEAEEGRLPRPPGGGRSSVERNRARLTWKRLGGAPRNGGERKGSRGGPGVRGRWWASETHTLTHTHMHALSPAVTHRIEAEFNKPWRGRAS